MIQPFIYFFFICVKLINLKVSLETSLRFHWTDPRLSPCLDSESSGDSRDSRDSYLTLHPRRLQEIWVPDIWVDQVACYPDMAPCVQAIAI